MFETEKYLRATAEDRAKNAKKKLAIVAMGNSMKDYMYVNFDKERSENIADEVWAINSMAFIIKNDMAVMMDDAKELEGRRAAYAERIKKELGNHPILTSRAYPDYPQMIQYPLADVLSEFQYQYFNGSVAYALAYALWRGYRNIVIYGCDYMYDHKPGVYERGRGCLEFWIAVGSERGAQIGVAKSSTLMDSNNLRFYGYREQPMFDVEKGPRGKPLVKFKQWVKEEPKNEQPSKSVHPNPGGDGRDIPKHNSRVRVRRKHTKHRPGDGQRNGDVPSQ